jgi:ferrous iron transport protein B
VTSTLLAPTPTLLLIGNPNVGKSVIFGHITGTYVTVSNYPGTTVDITRGKAKLSGADWTVVDTPGVNNLMPQSEDEAVTRDILLTCEEKRVLLIADAKNLPRALLLAVQLSEMEAPYVLVLNMADEAQSKGIRIDRKLLEARLGVPVIETVAIRRIGVGDLLRRAGEARVGQGHVTYSPAIEQAAVRVAALLPGAAAHISRRALALMLLAGDDSLKPWLSAAGGAAALPEIDRVRMQLREGSRVPVGSRINQERLQRVRELLRDAVSEPAVSRATLATRLGAWSMHPVWGVPILLAVLWVVYEFVGVFGAGTLVNLMEHKLFGGVVNPFLVSVAQRAIPWEPARALLVGEYGIFTMALTYGLAIILPVVTTFFIAFSIMEDSGYMPRLAVMSNRVLRRLGLSGKAVLPMILGLGCDTMATLTTRIMETRKERIIVTLLLALGVPCSAQLGVTMGMLTAMSPAGALIWAASVLGTIFLVGWLANQVLPGRTSDFILELPPFRRPSLGNILAKTLARLEWYLREALPLFVVGTLVLFLLDRFHLLGRIEAVSAPLVQGVLGLPEKATEAFLVGFLRRDYGAAGLHTLFVNGQLDGVQTVVALVTITLFIPCFANFLVMIKERGVKVALALAAFIVPFAFAAGGAVNFVLRALKVSL